MSSCKRFGVAAAMIAGLALATGVSAADMPRPGLSFLKFNVSDLAVMQAFYEKAFGMQQQKRLDFPTNTEVILTNPKGLDLALVFWKDKRAVTLGSANGAIGFYLEDVDGAYGRALAAGAKSVRPPTSMGADKVALVADPEGHEIELLHLD